MKSSASNTFIYTLTVFAAIGGFLFGYDTGVVSGAMLLIKDEFNLNSKWQELIVSSTVGVAALFAILGGILNDWLGRRPTIILASIFFAIGSIVMAVTPNKEILLVGRCIIGMGLGLSSMTISMFIGEVAPVERRGTLLLVNNAFLTGGQFFAAVVDGLFAKVPEGWRYMLGLAAIPAALQFIGFVFFMPESPRWYVMKGRNHDAEETLVRIRQANYTSKEYDDLIADQREKDAQSSIGILTALRNKSFLRALVVGCGLQLFQQLSAINTVMYYSASIFEMSGIRDPAMAIWMAAITAFFNFSFTFVGMWAVDRVGRRSLLFTSMIGVVFSLLFLSAGFYVSSNNTDLILTTGASGCGSYADCNSCQLEKDCGYCYQDATDDHGLLNFCLPVSGEEDADQSSSGLCANGTRVDDNVWWTEDYCPSKYSWMSLAGMIVYLMCFAPGVGTLPWAINAEIYAQEYRGIGNSFSTTTNWVTNFVVSLTFLSLTDALTIQGAFLLYMACTIAGLVFFFYLLPETKGVALDDVPKLFADGAVQVQCSSKSDGCVMVKTLQTFKPLTGQGNES